MPPNMQRKPALPEREWSITKEEKGKIVEFGRVLSKFIFEYARKEGADSGKFHSKIIAGGFQYFMDLATAKARAVSDDYLIVEDTLEKYGLGKGIDEPFTDSEPEETVEMKRERLLRELDALPLGPQKKENKDVPVDKDVEDASIPPSDVPVSMDKTDQG